MLVMDTLRDSWGWDVSLHAEQVDCMLATYWKTELDQHEFICRRALRSVYEACLHTCLWNLSTSRFNSAYGLSRIVLVEMKVRVSVRYRPLNATSRNSFNGTYKCMSMSINDV